MCADRKDDADLWERVKRTAKPLIRNRFNPHITDEAQSARKKSPPVKAETPKVRSSKIVRQYTSEPKISLDLKGPGKSLDDPTRKKIAKGRMSIEGRIDLHGLKQFEAHNRLLRFLDYSFQQGRRTVLVITGKGPEGEGVLRRAVPLWLGEPEFRSVVSGYSEAHLKHGGSGALYVRLRRKKP